MFVSDALRCRNAERQKRVNDIAVIEDLLQGAEAELNRRRSTQTEKFLIIILQSNILPPDALF